MLLSVYWKATRAWHLFRNPVGPVVWVFHQDQENQVSSVCLFIDRVVFDFVTCLSLSTHVSWNHQQDYNKNCNFWRIFPNFYSWIYSHLSSISVQFRAGEHPGGSPQPQQPAGDLGAAPGGLRRKYREILCQLPTGQRRKHRPHYIPDWWRPGCGERESIKFIISVLSVNISNDSGWVCNAFSIQNHLSPKLY